MQQKTPLLNGRRDFEVIEKSIPFVFARFFDLSGYCYDKQNEQLLH